MAGTFFVIDGPDGAGKTTQAARLGAYARERGRAVRLFREPGGTPAGEAIRDLLLDPETDLGARAEMLLYQAARAQIVEAVLTPALEAGDVVILDRYTYSTVAYQGYGLGLSVEEIRAAGRFASGGLEPVRAVFLDLDPDEGLGRLVGEPDRIERRTLDFHRRVRQGFLEEAERLGERAVVIDASRSVEEVAEAVRQAVEAHV